MRVPQDQIKRCGASVGNSRGDPLFFIPAPGVSKSLYEFSLPTDLTAPSQARFAFQAVSKNWDIRQDALDASLLVISELVTNAVRYALPPIVLRVHRQRINSTPRIWICVTDGGPAPCGDLEPTSDEHGRGLGIVSSLCEYSGVNSSRDGVTHWACLAC
nr:ATP-binding protein [Streptomyces chartreusis]